jgi:hypothetical protein
MFLRMLLVLPLLMLAAGEEPAGAVDRDPPPTAGVLDANAPRLRLLVRDSYLPGVPVLVRVEVTDANGVVDRDIWDADAVLSVSGNPTVGLSTTRVDLYNGLGSTLVTFTGKGDFQLTARVTLPGHGGAASSANQGSNVLATVETPVSLETTAALADASGWPVRAMSGSLRQSQTWSGIYHITGGDFTIPAGKTLTLAPGTLVLIDGVASGTGGPDLDVQGSIQALGTPESPVTFTAYTPGRNWGELHFAGARPSLFRYTEILQAGRSPGAAHTGTGPAIRASKSIIVFEHASLADHAGKIMQTEAGTELTCTDTLFTRAVMGPEIAGTALVFQNGWIIDMRHRDDADGIYIHSQLAQQTCILTGSVIAGIDDDGIDTLGSDIVVQDCIVRDCKDKAVSVYGGETTLLHCLLVDNNLAPEDPTIAAIAAKTLENGTAIVNLDHTTLVATRAPGHTDAGLQSHNKYGVKKGTIIYNVTNSIVDATEPVSVQAPYRKSDFHISYCDIVGMVWPGPGNLTADPQFVDPEHGDYRLGDSSPCLDRASPDSPLRDVGYYQSAPD